MKRQGFFILIGIFFIPALMAQVAVPKNTVIVSEVEREVIGGVYNGGEVSPFMLQLSVNYNLEESPEAFELAYRDFVDHLAKKRNKGLSDEDFLNFLFYRTHKVYLKRYEGHTSFSQVMNEGKYDCLTGTVLYALLLKEFDFPFTVVETDYHIYLLVSGEETTVLLETTDPINGFISDRETIENKISDINERNKTLSEQYLTFQSDSRNFTDLNKLAALQYYNASVLAFNSGQIIASIDQLEKARVYDDSPRFKNFGKLLAKRLVNTEEVDQQTKVKYLVKLTQFLNEGIMSASL
jgi:hypothetical protein